jgi:hypothetical protein
MRPTPVKKLKIGDYAIQHWTEKNEIRLVQVVDPPLSLENNEFWNTQTFVIDIEGTDNKYKYHIENTNDCKYYKVEHDKRAKE